MFSNKKRKLCSDVNIQFSIWKDAFARMRRNTISMISLVIILIMVIIAIIGPLLTPYDFLSQNLEVRSEKPSSEYVFGTDSLGRDILSRIIYGTRTAALVSITSIILSTVLGVIIGSVSAFIGGKFDIVVLWIIDLFVSVPPLLIAVVAGISFKPVMGDWMEMMYMRTKNPFFREAIWVDFILIVSIITLTMWPTYARLIRGQFLSIKKQNYVMAARALAVKPAKIIAKYMIPNALGPIIVAMSAGFGSAILTEATFSFLGIGVRPPMPSWGNMLREGLNQWTTAPHLLIGPGLVICIITIAFSFFGDGLNDALDPKQQRR